MTVTGEWATRTVHVDGKPLSPKRSIRVFNHSPTGFNWSYSGSGPAQLALAILLQAGIPPTRAVRLHQRFKFEFIARLPEDDFELTVDVADWVARHEKDES